MYKLLWVLLFVLVILTNNKAHSEQEIKAIPVVCTSTEEMLKDLKNDDMLSFVYALDNLDQENIVVMIYAGKGKVSLVRHYREGISCMLMYSTAANFDLESFIKAISDGI